MTIKVLITYQQDITYDMITNKNEAEIMAKHISCDSKCKFDSVTYNSNQSWNNETF